MTPGHDSTLNCDPGHYFTLKFDTGSWFNVELWPRVLIPHWIMTPCLNSTLNCDPESWFNVKLWPRIRIIIQCVILTRGHNSTWHFDPRSQFNVAFWPGVTIQRWILTRLHIVYPWNNDSTFNSLIKIQQLWGSQFNEKSIENWPRVDFQWRGQNFILHRRCCSLASPMLLLSSVNKNFDLNFQTH